MVRYGNIALAGDNQAKLLHELLQQPQWMLFAPSFVNILWSMCTPARPGQGEQHRSQLLFISSLSIILQHKPQTTAARPRHLCLYFPTCCSWRFMPCHYHEIDLPRLCLRLVLDWVCVQKNSAGKTQNCFVAKGCSPLLPRVARGLSYMCTKWRQLRILSGINEPYWVLSAHIRPYQNLTSRELGSK